MDDQSTPLGKAGFLVIPIAIILAYMFPSFWTAVAVGAAVGLTIANVRAVMCVVRLQALIGKNPLFRLQAELQGTTVAAQIRFIFIQSILGALVIAIFTAFFSGVALLFR